MDNIEKLIEWYNRILFYSNIHLNADNSKIANLAQEELIISFLNILDSNGLDFLKNKVLESNDSKFISYMLVAIAPYDLSYALKEYNKFLKNKNPVFIFSQPYGLQNMENPTFHSKTLEFHNKIKLKREKK